MNMNIDDRRQNRPLIMQQPTLKEPIIIVGIGEIGGVFARGFLKLRHPVYPVTRIIPLAQAARDLPAAAPLVLIAVGEAALPEVLAQVPTVWRNKIALVQNELLPPDWERHGIVSPTVISVWFEKKPNQEVRVVLPSPIFGPQADLLAAALMGQCLPTQVSKDPQALRYELVRKNVYILVSNIAGLRTGGTVGELWAKQRALATSLAREVVEIQGRLLGATLDPDPYIEGMQEAFAGDPGHQCMGRSALSRLERALAHADAFGIAAPTLRGIQAEMAASD